MNKIKLSIAIFALLFAFNNAKAQFSHFAEITTALNPASYGMNFFVGKDAALFQTTGQALGSGILDFSGTIPLLPYWIQAPGGDKKFAYAFPIGVRISKYRFAQNLVFSKNETTQMIDVYADTVSTRSYNHSFFSYEGSKLAAGYIHIPAIFRWDITDKFVIDGSVFYDRCLFSYHKLKYTENERTQKDVIRNNEFKNYYLNKNKYGLSLGIRYAGFGIGATYVPTPFFLKGQGPEIQELRVGLSYARQK